MVALALIPFLYPVRLLQLRQRSEVGRYATDSKGPRIPRERWPEVVTRVQREGLRAVARGFGVSHETVPSLVRVISVQERVSYATERGLRGRIAASPRGSARVEMGCDPHRRLVTRGQRLGNHLLTGLCPTLLPGGGERSLPHYLPSGGDRSREAFFLL